MSPAELAASVVEALKDPSVRAGILEAVVKPAVEAAVREAVAANNEEVSRLIAQQQAKIDGLEAQVKRLSSVVTEQAQCLNELDQYGRKSCVVVSGVPEQANESVRDRMEELGRVVGVNLQGEIDVAHRLGRLAPGRPRPIIVRLRTFDKRQELYAARRKLRSAEVAPSGSISSTVAAQVFISDSLTKTNQEILYRGRQLKKEGRLWAVWSDAGKLKAKVRDGDPTTIIRSVNDLARLVGDDVPPPPETGPAAALTVGRADPAEAGAAPAAEDAAADGFVQVGTGARNRPRREATRGSSGRGRGGRGGGSA